LTDWSNQISHTSLPRCELHCCRDYRLDALSLTALKHYTTSQENVIHWPTFASILNENIHHFVLTQPIR